jgi:hypothetical protein
MEARFMTDRKNLFRAKKKPQHIADELSIPKKEHRIKKLTLLTNSYGKYRRTLLEKRPGRRKGGVEVC